MASDIQKIYRELEDAQKQVETAVMESINAADIENVRIKYLSRKGIITGFFGYLGEISNHDRPELGKRLNALKQMAQEKIGEKSALFAAKTRASEFFDTSLPGIMPRTGGKHPLKLVLDEIKQIFLNMGFSIETGPELETDYYNFEALNIPKYHPSRDLQDTLYITETLLLRTHTSPVQVRTMERMKPPIRMIAPGKCFRKDAIDATHYPTFHQVEGLCVDEGISFADLKGVISAFAKRLLGEDVQIRFRPSFFPFTEPSAEYDFSCTNCHGKGCRVCKGSGWLEISGAGMVNPAVFEYVGYDPQKYTGYAFGMGVERIAMLKYQIDDIRIFYENDLRFLTQF